MLDDLDIEIIKVLREHKSPLSSNQIGIWVNKSSRTVRNRIKGINGKLVTYEAQIEMLPGVGIQLNIRNHKKFEKLWLTISTENGYASENDLRNCIQLFVSQADYLNADEICEQLFVSKSKLTNILKDLRRILKQYKLELEVKPHHGMKLVGSEIDLRRFISSYYVQGNSFDNLYNIETLDSRIWQELLQIVKEEMQILAYPIPVAIRSSLVSHLFITLLRISKGLTIDQVEQQENEGKNIQEYQLAQRIVARIEEKYSVEFPTYETRYIAMHIIGKKVLNVRDKKRISPEVNQLVDEILKKIYQDKKINLLNDFDLRMMLGLHLVPLLSRISYGIELKNPIIDEVKVKCLAGYDLAIICGRMINEQYSTLLSDHELSYFAIHFDVALYKEQERIDKKKILIICSSGRASGQLLKIKFEQLFTKYLNRIDVCDVSEAPSKLNNDYDYVFTTIPLSNDSQFKMPVFEFSFFLDDLSIRKIESVLVGNQNEEISQFFSSDLFFGELDLNSRKTILDFMLKKIKKNRHVPHNFGELVLERENFLGTDLVKNIAFPHPSRVVTEETFIAVALLKKPVFWEKRWVKIVVLVSISKYDSDIYKSLLEKIVKVMTSPERVERIVRHGDFQGLITELKDSEKEG